jgi:diguanylate cyclase (GGDEF)-like protein/PAS domain S-box-containing protein
MVLAQTAIGLGLVPSMISEPRVYDLAALSLFAVLVTIALLGRATAACEQVEDDLRQSETRFEAFLSNAADVIAVADGEGRLKYVSPSFERTLGLSPDSYYGESTAKFIHPEDFERVREKFVTLASAPENAIRTQLRIRDSKGTWRQFEATITNQMDDPDVRGIVGNLHDITELLEAHEWFRSAFEDAPTGMALTSINGVILRANRAYGSILGRSPTEILGRRLDDFTHPDDAGQDELELRRVTEEDSGGYEIEKRYIHTDGREIWAMVHVSCVRDSVGRPRYLIAQIQDVTESRGMRERLEHAAIHDPLTGLPNRALFLDRLNMALRRVGRNGRQVAVAFLDLDRFKLVNDGLGHAAGDELLRAAAARLSQSLRAEDTVARFGGDEFTILWELDPGQDALAVTRRVLDELQRPFDVDGAPVFVTASAGVVVCNDTLSSASNILRDADSAMYVAKETGRARVELFDGEGSAKALESLRVMSELHSAVSNGELVLHYQPIVDLSSGAVVALEALVRWQHPERGLLGPDQFISLAEESGLIVPLGAWVLQQACTQAARWHEGARASGREALEMAVNLSPRQLVDPGFVECVSAALTASGIAPSTLSLEITESTLMRNERASAEALHSLRELGVRISIDDFGTGYSSLSYLKHFPIDSMKIDRTFVDGIGEEADDSVIASAVIALAHSLGLTAVAEGVETEIALEELRQLGCDRVQGFLLGRPQPVDQLEAVLFESHVPEPPLAIAASGLALGS